MSTIPLNSNFVFNSTLQKNNWFPVPVRSSSSERLKRHTSQFTCITTVFSLSYHLLSLSFKFAIKQAAISFFHKGTLAFIFFYTNELIWGFLSANKEQNQQAKSSRIPSWATLGLTSVILFPLTFALNKVYRLSPKKTVFRSLVDVLLLFTFGLQFERNIRSNRKTLQTGTEQQRKVLIELVK